MAKIRDAFFSRTSRFPTKSARRLRPIFSQLVLPLSFFLPLLLVPLCLCVTLSICPSVHPFVCLSVCASPRLYVCVSLDVFLRQTIRLSPSCRSFSLVVPAIAGFSYVFVRPRCRAATYARVDEGTQLHSRDVTFRGLVRTVCDGERGHRWTAVRSNVLLPKIVTFPLFPTTRGSSILRVSLSPFGRTRSFLRSLLLLCDGARHVILADFLGQHRRIAILCPLKAGNERRLTRYLSLL